MEESHIPKRILNYDPRRKGNAGLNKRVFNRDERGN